MNDPVTHPLDDSRFDRLLTDLKQRLTIRLSFWLTNGYFCFTGGVFQANREAVIAAKDRNLNIGPLNATDQQRCRTKLRVRAEMRRALQKTNVAGGSNGRKRNYISAVFAMEF